MIEKICIKLSLWGRIRALFVGKITIPGALIHAGLVRALNLDDDE